MYLNQTYSRKRKSFVSHNKCCTGMSLEDHVTYKQLCLTCISSVNKSYYYYDLLKYPPLSTIQQYIREYHNNKTIACIIYVSR